MARSRRKMCKVWLTRTVTHEYNGKKYDREERYRCEAKIKPGTPFCKEHFETHKLVEVECTGEAHSNPFIDNCWTCMPFWGRYPVAVPKEAEGKPWEREWGEGGN